MPLQNDDPAHLSKSRLKSDLVAHNVAVPPANSKKDVYVELRCRHIGRQRAVDFSSDEEDHEHEEPSKEGEDPGDAEVPDPCVLTDRDLMAALLQHGFKAGPIVASTRALYEKKLRRLLQAAGRDGHLNGEENGALFSDSEDEQEGSEGANEGTVELSDQSKQEGSQRACASSNWGPCSKRNSGNALKSSEWSQSHCAQIPVGISRASSVDQRSGLGSRVPSGSQSAVANHSSSLSFSITEMVEEMESRMSLAASKDTERELNGSKVQEHWSRYDGLDSPITDAVKNQSVYCTPEALPSKSEKKVPAEPVSDVLKDLFPDTKTMPTGIYATRRRPIKGAAGRPIQYKYPDTPTSPTTLERREVERRLVPIHIQILLFLILVVLLYLIYAFVEDGSFSSLNALLDGQNQGSDNGERLLGQAYSQDAPALSGHE